MTERRDPEKVVREIKRKTRRKFSSELFDARGNEAGFEGRFELFELILERHTRWPRCPHDLDSLPPAALPKPGRYREMFRLVSRLHATRLHRDRPLWEAHIIEGVEGESFDGLDENGNPVWFQVDDQGNTRPLQGVTPIPKKPMKIYDGKGNLIAEMGGSGGAGSGTMGKPARNKLEGNIAAGTELLAPTGAASTGVDFSASASGIRICSG